jgi:DNA-binding PadR family transcriptional regulator
MISMLCPNQKGCLVKLLRVTPQVKAVLEALEKLADEEEEFYPYGIVRQLRSTRTPIPISTMSEILHRLEKVGWLSGRSETPSELRDRNQIGSVPRRYYRWTAKGREGFARLQEEQG